MERFEDRKITVSKIYSVEKYSALRPKKIEKYGSELISNELVYFVKGENDTYFGKTYIKDCPGALRYMPKGKIDGDYIVKNIVSPTLCFDVYFDGDFYFDYPLGLYGNKKLEDKFFKLYDIWSKKEMGYYMKAMSVFYDILFCLQENKREYLDQKKKEYIKLAYEYIAKNYKSDSFDYKELSKTSGLEYSYFFEIFKKAYGMSPVEFVTNMKIDYAKELLITNRYSVTRISQMCGFKDVYYFSKVFKKKTGFSPKKYPFGFF